MLEINPHFRPSASELLKNKIFDQMRVPSNEKIEPKFKIKIRVDNNELMYDYKNNKDG